MRIPKRYGQSKTETCPFCDKLAVTTNSQGVSVCKDHKNSLLQDIKCACGEWLDIRSGKFGAYFHCMNCGNINFKKGLEMNSDSNNSRFNYNKALKNNTYKNINSSKEPQPAIKSKQESNFNKSNSQKKEITITSAECDVYYS